MRSRFTDTVRPILVALTCLFLIAGAAFASSNHGSAGPSGTNVTVTSNDGLDEN